MNCKKYSAEYQSLCITICQRSSQHSKIMRILRILRIIIILGILGILIILRILRILRLNTPASRLHQILSSRTVYYCVFPSFPRCPRWQTRCLRCSRCPSLPASASTTIYTSFEGIYLYLGPTIYRGIYLLVPV